MPDLRFIAFTLALGLAVPSFAQSFREDRWALQQDALALTRAAEYERQQAQWLAAYYGIEPRIETHGRTIEISRFEAGAPVYRATLSNLDAARSLLVPSLWPGGDLGLNLTGAGARLGIWDGGTPRATHQEFRGRVSLGDTEGPGDHATHVAGTMVATGVNPVARGMAYQAQLVGFGWNNDQGEMAAAAANGLTVSNHSYGLLTGWFRNGAAWYWMGRTDLSQTQDAAFGWYNSTAAGWDSVAARAPFYTIVKAAGNDRGEGPAAGSAHFAWTASGWQQSTATRDRDGGAAGFDSLPPDSTGKNILVIGAVNDVVGANRTGTAISMSSFSGWGPTDDGRIKPDLVANGVGLTSPLAGGDTLYGTMSGTSMASPNASGAIALLQQHYRNLNSGQNPRSSTVRAILVHTADEAGANPGPDYTFGWGLINARAAAQLITADGAQQRTITENTLTSGRTFSMTINVTQAGPLRVTLAWLDPARSALPAALNSRTPALVHDLDLRVVRGTSTTLPWALNPAQPNAAATRADNRVDNVEQVLLPQAATGQYTVTVRAKNPSLTGGSQVFSLVVTGASSLNAPAVRR